MHLHLHLKKECKSIGFKNTLESDPSINCEIFPNCNSETLSEVTGKMNKKEDLIRKEKLIKEFRKRKRSTSDPQSEAPLALKILKASTLLNRTISRTFTGFYIIFVMNNTYFLLLISHKYFTRKDN